ncbi:hypothetical protein HBH64_233520 [Parastagonospora nodorum]|nr:hypothetical protein HBI01_240870 [Parastagonospora nodorum]KAH4319855.1 hypothetical protein HBI00_235780 [Parastagonospora nodorum]KAH4355028.1 hypothetical protein HBH94_241700 [Parastagonospora nodorum]KAH4438380.1 hypothetical protein HBH90_241220 [Parastagonospora nodorum]KAH4472619.1 hypothetical protein HBH88_246070 [Parastagonospora nodorum]
MSDNQSIDIEQIVAEISNISDNANTTVQKMDAAVIKEDLSRDLIIQTYKETSKSHILIIKRLQDAYGKFSKREVERIRDKTSRQKQAERRDDGTAEPVDMELQADNSKLLSNVKVLEREIENLKGKNAQLGTKNEVLEGENAQLKEENAQLEKDKTQLEKEKNQLSKDDVALKEENTQLEKDKTQLEKDKTQLEKEKNQLSKDDVALKEENTQLEKNKTQLSTGNEALKGGKAQLKGEVVRWKGQFEDEKKLHNEVETNKELQKNIHKTNEAHAEIPPSEPTTTPIGGSSDQNRAPGTPEENATPNQSRVHWEGALAFARAIVSTALAFTVVFKDQAGMEDAYQEGFAMNCTDFMFFIHSLRPDESPSALEVEWPPEWLDPDNGTEEDDWHEFCRLVGHTRSNFKLDDPTVLVRKELESGSTLKTSIETRLDEISSWKGTRLETFPSTLLMEDQNIFGIAVALPADEDE